MKYDLYLVGVGGQGVLTIADLIAETAIRAGIPANFYPTKGMAQRGGSVKAQVRLGREQVGPQIPQKGADLAIAMELSESLKAVRFVRPGGELLVYGYVWHPTAVMLGKASYPTLEAVGKQIVAAGVALHYLDPAHLPQFKARPVPANVYVLGAALGRTRLGEVLDPSAVEDLVVSRWKQGVEANRLAFQAGTGG
jgi:indolepyruvate ferredoxin oxidoreductase beta subunit